MGDGMDIETKPILSSPNFTTSEESENVKGKWTPRLVLAASAAVIGSSFQFGYNTGVINAPGDVIEQFINETHFNRYGTYVNSLQLKLLWGFTVSIFAVGGMAGSFVAGNLAERFGRKKVMLANNILVLIAIAFMGCSKFAASYEMLIIGRLIIGVNCGINTAVAPLYLTEIAPLNLRGVLGISNQLGIVTALLISQALGLSYVLGTKNDWPLLLMLCGVFALYQLLILPFCPETPAYLLSKGQVEDAKDALKFLRANSDVDDEISALQSELTAADDEDRISIVEIFKTADLRKPMFIAMVLQCAQQLSGINAVFYYSTSIFESVGFPPGQSDLVTLGMGAANVIMTMISLFLVERLGRRILLLTGLGGMCICSIVLVVSLAVVSGTTWASVTSVIFVLLYVISFETGPGSIPWFITAELFTEAARASAMSVAALVNWAGNFTIGLAFPALKDVIGGYTFAIFAALLAIFWVYTFFKVPETKGRSTQEISNLFKTT